MVSIALSRKKSGICIYKNTQVWDINVCNQYVLHDIYY